MAKKAVSGAAMRAELEDAVSAFKSACEKHGAHYVVAASGGDKWVGGAFDVSGEKGEVLTELAAIFDEWPEESPDAN